NENFLKQYDINLSNNVKVIAINNEKKLVKLSNSQVQNYDKLLYATGASCKVPNVEGFDLNNVFTLRNYSDMLKIKQSSLNCKKITIIGASFIGMEMASTLRKMNPKSEI